MWDVVWKTLELLSLNTKYEFFILLLVHFCAAIFMILLNSCTTLFGFGKISKENKTIEINPDESNEKIRIFQIKYLSLYYGRQR